MLVAVVALLAPAAAKEDSSCMDKTDCKLDTVWSEWAVKFDPANFTVADGGWSKAQTHFMNLAKIEHWIDEWHMDAGCCEHWRCNNDTFRCEAPSAALATAVPLLLLALVAAAQLVL
jgi:hypothetical protein